MKGLGQTSEHFPTQHVEGYLGQEGFGLPVRPGVHVAVEGEQVAEGNLDRQTDVYDSTAVPESPSIAVVRTMRLPPVSTSLVNLALIHATQVEKVVVLSKPNIWRSVHVQMRWQVSHEHMAGLAVVLVSGPADLAKLLDD